MEIDLKINYSVIIPHKNIPELLDRCLQSIPIRDDVQIIVVDDNSDPDKVDFSKFPGLERPNTEVYFTKEGKGAGYARNVGLSKAKGKWLVFADADDFFNDCLSEMFDKYKLIEADLVFFQTNSIDNVTLEPVKSRGEKYNDLLKRSKDTNSIHNEVRFRIFPPWGKFYSKNLIDSRNLNFDEIFTSNDVMFSTISGYYANRVLIDSNFLYCSTVRVGSLEKNRSIEYITPRFFTSIRHYKFLLTKKKSKYRMNVWIYIYELSKHNNKWIKDYVFFCLKEMKTSHLVHDLFSFMRSGLIRKISIYRKLY